ncbi:MAG TPA: tetratricopeptide repeat protein [Bryobacteraceae bacterium]|nr:tetratricopeptide repeat protein [Bryobacteraceae bacterium]
MAGNSVGVAGDPHDPTVRPSSEQVRAELEKICASRLFIRSDRLRRFLRFTVENALNGELDQLNEQVIGRDVFDRKKGYDPQIDSIVRVEARRLRSKLADYYRAPGASDPVQITLEKGGYVPAFRYVTPSAPPRKSAPDVRTVAVLPFVNLSSDPDQDFFCDGITEEILNALTTIPELNVVARTSVFHFKGAGVDVREIGERLGAGTVIEGSVRKADSRLRISAKAINAITGLSLWSGTYERDLIDVFAIQDEIARAIADSLRVSLAPPAAETRHDRDFEGYMLYLRGRHYWNQMSQDGIENALNQFTRAIALFPDYAPPYAALADAYGHLASWGAIPPGEATSRAKQAALDALRLDDRLADAHATMGAILSFFEWKWEEGAALLTRAIGLQPSNVHAHELFAIHFMYRGEFEKALTCINKALQLDPLSPRGLRFKAGYYSNQRRYDEAIDVLRAALPLGRDSTDREALFLLGSLYTLQGRYKEAIEILEKLPEGPFLVTKLGAVGEANARAGNAGAAQEALKTLDHLAATEYVSPRSAVYIHAGLGNWDRALEELDKACTDHCPWLPTINIDPRFDAVRAHPRFINLQRRMNL